MKPHPLIAPDHFHEACGTGFIVTQSGKPEKRILLLALTALKRLTHRGAKSADKKTGDGSGILTDIPKSYFKQVLADEFNYKFPKDYTMGIAMVFTTPHEKKWLIKNVTQQLKSFAIELAAIRETPTNPKVLGQIAFESRPITLQFLVGIKNLPHRSIESHLYLVRKSIEKQILLEKKKSYFCSFSSKTVVYKGLMSSTQLDQFFMDLAHPDYIVKMVLFHERFSTNTASTWAMAQPFRMVAHNGEFNTIKGNRLWMQAREGEIQSEFWGADLKLLKPLVNMKGSDSLSFDNALEFLVHSGKNIFQSMMMMVPDPYDQYRTMKQTLKDFYIYHENFMEPWDGPAALVYTDGDIVGAKMDRNGLRPLRYSITKDGLVVMASEAGIIDIEDDNLDLHHHMQSGEIFGVDLKTGAIYTNTEIKDDISTRHPYSVLLKNNLKSIEPLGLEEEFTMFDLPSEGFDQRLRVAFGWTAEDLTRFLIPMATSGREPMGSMGDDTPIAAMSDQTRRFYDYFKQMFAQVTNPPIDSIRERSVMALFKYLGSEENLLTEKPSFDRSIRINSPILSPREVTVLYQYHGWFPHRKIKCHYKKEKNIEARIERIKKLSKDAVEEGVKIIFLSNEGISPDTLSIPMAIVVSTVHHYLVKKKLRSRVSLICLSADVVEDHHVAVLIGFGASAVYPYMAYELIREHFKAENWVEAMANYRFALEKGLLKIMGKMGISTISSYHGSMLFHIVGLDKTLSKKYFPSNDSLIGGINMQFIHEALVEQSTRAFQHEKPDFSERGFFRFHRSGEAHGFSPNNFKQIIRLSKGKSVEVTIPERPVYIRDLLTAKSQRNSIALDSVEPASSLLSRFGSGGVSFGAISDKAHRDLARGMYMAGARSNTGEGGEPQDRIDPLNPDKSLNSFTKQIASGRFGVTVDYLSAAQEIQIKMAQGAKPGEGGQLPGNKVSTLIANARSSTPGIPLISPPPHHDIYSIEDLKQLIFDLKRVNPRAKICVKLVSQPGIGTIASGVVKAGADIILISGADGGTGASPLGSMKHAGFPWEIGLAETHQVLNENGLRDRVTIRIDGGIKTSRDIVMAAVLGAEEYDFGTAALVALGCVMVRRCHLNTCPAGIATQDETYTGKYKGKAENVKVYLESVAESLRIDLSKLGFADIHSIVGRTDLLRYNNRFRKYMRKRGINLDIIMNPKLKMGLPLELELKVSFVESRKEQDIDQGIINEIRPQLLTHGQAVIYREINNTHRSVGTKLSGEIAFLFGNRNFHGRIQYRLNGTAGQSFGAFLANGIELRLKGIANDYVGKGMSGGLITIRMPKAIRKRRAEHTVIGNVALYGATGGEVLIAGKAGERFGVRNSGASGVVEGIGNHGCEYMTRGTIVILGEIGNNFGAGMTGGLAMVYAKNRDLHDKLNHDYVKESEIDRSSENMILRLLRNHIFHTGSSIGSSIIDNWDANKKYFRKITPKALDIVDLDRVYDMQIADKMNVMLNE